MVGCSVEDEGQEEYGNPTTPVMDTEAGEPENEDGDDMDDDSAEDNETNNGDTDITDNGTMEDEVIAPLMIADAGFVVDNSTVGVLFKDIFVELTLYSDGFKVRMPLPCYSNVNAGTSWCEAVMYNIHDTLINEWMYDSSGTLTGVTTTHMEIATSKDAFDKSVHHGWFESGWTSYDTSTGAGSSLEEVLWTFSYDSLGLDFSSQVRFHLAVGNPSISPTHKIFVLTK